MSLHPEPTPLGSRRHERLRALVPLLGIWLAACSLPARVPPEEIASTCRRVCEREASCTPSASVEPCADACASSANLISGETFRALSACLAELPCERDSATCLDAVEPSPAYQAYAARCVQRIVECGAAAEDAQTACELELVQLLADDVLIELTACFDAACEAISACNDGVIARRQ